MEDFGTKPIFEQTREEILSEESVDSWSRAGMNEIKNRYKLELNNFELLRVREITKNVLLQYVKELELSKNDKEYTSLSFEAIIKPQIEISCRFLIEEYGVNPADIKISLGELTDDFIKYLKILQKRNREGNLD